jgi:sodium transport system permease protein
MKNVMTVIKKELYKVFSNRRKAFFAVIFPGLMLYLMYSTIVNVQLNEANQLDEQISNVIIVEAPDNFNLSDSFKIVSGIDSTDYEKLVHDGVVDLVVYFEGADFERIVSDKNSEYHVNVIYNPTLISSREARRQILSELELISDEILMQRYEGDNVLSAFELNEQATGDMRKLVTASLASLSFIVIFFMFSGAQTHGIESLVKEKEQKTISSVLITPIKRLEFIVGKMISVFTLGMIYFLSSLVGMLMAFREVIFPQGGSVGSGALMSGMELTMIILVLLSLMVMFVSAIMLLSLISKTQKDAGIFTAAMHLIIIVSGFTTMTESFVIPTQLSYFMIPVYNAMLSVKAILTFTYSTELIVVTILSSLVYSAICIGLMVGLAKKENIIYSS